MSIFTLSVKALQLIEQPSQADWLCEKRIKDALTRNLQSLSLIMNDTVYRYYDT